MFAVKAGLCNVMCQLVCVVVAGSMLLVLLVNALQAGLCNMMCQLVYVVVAGSMLLVLLMTMATASLSASFSVFLVRERANKSKHVQVSLPCCV